MIPRSLVARERVLATTTCSRSPSLVISLWSTFCRRLTGAGARHLRGEATVGTQGQASTHGNSRETGLRWNASTA